MTIGNKNSVLINKSILLSIVIPVFNESKRIHHLKTVVDYCRAKKYICEIIVVDDGSTDETVFKAKEILKDHANQKVIPSNKNYGKGHAVAMGMKEALGEYHLFMDIDLSTPLVHIDEAINEIRKSDIVIGTRKNGKALLLKRQPWLRENLGKAFTFLSSLILNTWISDFTCGFKLFTREASRAIFLATRIDRWAFDSEVLFLARKMSFKVLELPVSWQNDDGTKVKLTKVIVPTMIDLLKVRFNNYSVIKHLQTTGKAQEYLLKPRTKNIIIPLFLATFFLIRIILFLITQDVGIEHDSAWYLGVAKNFASKGIYASFTNTSIDEKQISKSIHNRVSVQDENGLTYFPAGVTVGPGYVIPQAILMKIFGFGFWQYRLLPLLGYFLFVFLLLWIVVTYGGYFSLFLFSTWLWMRADFIINQSFEAYSEHLSLVYLLVSLKLISDIRKNDLNKKRLFFGGLFLGLSVMTKSLNFLSVPAFFILLYSFTFDFWGNLIFFIRRALYFSLGFILPISVFEIYKYIFLFQKFGKAGYNGVNLDALLTLKAGGSGIVGAKLSLDFISAKLNFWQNNSTISSALVWIAFLCIEIIFSRYFSKSSKLPFAIWLTVLFQFLWFIIASQTGWYRHVWQASILTMLLFSLAANIAYKRLSSNVYVLVICAFAALYVFFSAYEGEILNGVLIKKDVVNKKWATNFVRTPNGLQTQVFSPIFSWKDVYDLSLYINNKIDSNKKIYYFQSFLVTEASTISERVFYPHVRMKYDKERFTHILIGPYQKGKLSLTGKDYYKSILQEICKETLYENDSYLLCRMENIFVSK